MAGKALARALWMVALAFSAGAAQNDARPAGVSGTVVNALTGQPLPKAHVTLKASIRGTIRKFGAIANEQGQFSIRPIDAGSYRTSVELPGFRFAPAKAVDNGRVEIAEGATVSDLKLKLMPHGVIAGRVLDANGDPVERAGVMAMRGSRKMAEHLTDAEGEFRLSGLPPGKYVVCARPVGAGELAPPEIRTDGSRQERSAVTYFGNTSRQAEATAVDVHGGAEVNGVEIRLLSRRAVRVSGNVTGLLADADALLVTIVSPYFTLSVHPPPKMVIWGLPPSDVRLLAFAKNDDDEPVLSAPLDLQVGDSDIDNLELPLLPAFVVKGRVDWDGPAPQSDQMHDPKLELVPLRGAKGTVSGALEDGAFELPDVKPDRYAVAVSGMPGDAFVKSMRLGSREMTDGILDVRRGVGDESLTLILSTAGGQVSGVASDATGPLMEAAVGLADDRSGRIEMAQTGGDGGYRFHGLHPGSYKLFLFDGEDFASLAQSGSLGVYEADAVKIAINEGDRVVRDLRQ